MAWLAPHEGRPGRPPVFSDAALRFCLSIKVPLRQTSGMVARRLRIAGLDGPVPDCATLWRRPKRLAVQIPCRRADGPTGRRADGPLSLIMDSTGIKFLGDGDWQARKHGPQGRRQGRKLHLMATAKSDTRAVAFTPGRVGDSPVLPDLLNQIPQGEPIGTVTADGAYDTRRRHTAILHPCRKRSDQRRPVTPFATGSPKTKMAPVPVREQTP